MYYELQNRANVFPLNYRNTYGVNAFQALTH